MPSKPVIIEPGAYGGRYEVSLRSIIVVAGSGIGAIAASHCLRIGLSISASGGEGRSKWDHRPEVRRRPGRQPTQRDRNAQQRGRRVGSSGASLCQRLAHYGFARLENVHGIAPGRDPLEDTGFRNRCCDRASSERLFGQAPSLRFRVPGDITQPWRTGYNHCELPDYGRGNREEPDHINLERQRSPRSGGAHMRRDLALQARHERWPAGRDVVAGESRLADLSTAITARKAPCAAPPWAHRW